MTNKVKRDSRLNFRLPSELKNVIEAAAAQLGQSISEYAVATLVEDARAVLFGVRRQRGGGSDPRPEGRSACWPR